MTRGEIKQFAKALLGVDNLGDDESLTDRQVDQSTNELCRAAGCFYLSYVVNLKEGQQLYSAPPLYDPQAISAILSDGKEVLLVKYTAKQLDDLCPLWRWDPNTNQPTTGDPICYIPNGLSTVWLYPVPDYDAENGLTMEGLGVPKDGHISLWPDEHAQCPLPARGHEAVGYRLASLRCLQRYAQEKDQSLLALRQQFEAEYRVLRGYVEAAAPEFIQQVRYRVVASGDTRTLEVVSQ